MTFPKLLGKIKIKNNCKRFDDLNLKIKPHFIKIDTEGYDEFVLRGLKKH